MNNNYIFISAGMLKKKKKHQENHVYLNYAILGLATILKSAENNVIVYQGELFTPEKLIELLLKKYRNQNNTILISIPSFFAVSWGIEFIKLVRFQLNCKIILGGRWVLSNKSWALKTFKDVDIIVNGQAESILTEVLKNKEQSGIPEYINASLPEKSQLFNKLDYSLLDSYKTILPSIELSRGCGMGCGFCADKNVLVSNMKSPEKLVNEIQEISKVYNDKNIQFYFESSIFKPKKNWINEFYELYNKYNLKNQWRCETRADINLNEESIKLLALSGLKVIDLGLESASHIQLKRMQKTNNPLKYLEKAQQFIRLCFKYGIWVKVNVLLYPGETEETLNETIDFLENNKKYFKGLSVYPTLIYGSDKYTVDFLKEIEKYGASSLNGKIEDNCITNLNLSSEINYEKAKQLSIEIGKNFMSKDDYFDLKSFSYYPRDYTYNDFINHISNIEEEYLPFS
ncbi:MAG: B12-binding domain-containing radical SAM protein [Halarcobacter sp.]